MRFPGARDFLACMGFMLIGNAMAAGIADLSNADATDRVGLAQQYNFIAGQAASVGLVKEDQATIERYVTQKALDGLYFMIGEQGKAFRQNPLGATSDIVRKVFGALR